MTCPKCKETGILNQANGKDFYFCEKCREEIFLEETSKSKEITQKEIDEIFKDFYWSNTGSYVGNATEIQGQVYITLEEYEQECLSVSPHWSDKE